MQARSHPPRGWPYESVYAFIAREGRAFPRVEATDGKLRGRARECFFNAAQVALHDPARYVYVEGYATAVIPVHHGWVWDRHGARALEVTWEQPSVGYWGVPFAASYLAEALYKRGKYGLIDAWERRWPLLSGEDRIEDAIERLEG